jgi:hypothetical protein
VFSVPIVFRIVILVKKFILFIRSFNLKKKIENDKKKKKEFSVGYLQTIKKVNVDVNESGLMVIDLSYKHVEKKQIRVHFNFFI